MIKTDNFSNSIYFKVDQVQDKDKPFDAEKTLKQDCIHYRFSKPDTNSEPTAEFHGRVRKIGHEETSEHNNKGTRKSARPRFLSGQ